MIKKILIAIAFLTGSVPLTGQEYLHGFDEFTFPRGHEAVLFNGEVHLPVLLYEENIRYPEFWSGLVRVDQDGKLQSFQVWPDTADTRRHTTHAIQAVGEDSLLLFSQTDQEISSPLTTAINVYDTAYQLKHSLPATRGDSSTFVTYRNHIKGDSLILVGNTFYTNGLSMRETIRVYRDTSLVLEKYFDLSLSFFLRSIHPWGDKWLVGERGGLDYLLVLDDQFEEDTILSRTGQYNPHPSFDNFIDDIHSDGFYALGKKLNDLVIYKYDQNLNVRRIDTFSTYPSSTGEVNIRPVAKISSFRSPDSIFMAASKGSSFSFDWNSDTTMPTGLKVVLVDTSGYKHWEKTIDDGRSHYNIFSLQTTEDGGLLLFSAKYDPNYKTEAHSRLSIIKIQANGEVLHEHEYALPRKQKLALYPNPVGARLHYDDLPSEREVQRYRLYDQAGQLWKETSGDPAGEILVEGLPPGVYFLQLEDQRGGLYKGRFIKE